MAASRRDTILGWGTFLVAVLTYVAPLGQNIQGVRVAQVVATIFVLYLVLPPARRRATDWLEVRGRMRHLVQQWPAFRARVTTFREFFSPDNTSSFAATITRSGKAPAEYDHVLKIQDFLALMDSLSLNTAQDAQRVPNMTDARRIIRDFENLLPRVESRGIRLLLQLTEARLEGVFTAYAGLRQSYREFASEANAHIGEVLFDGDCSVSMRSIPLPTR